jgi:hypothetical protein
VPLRIAETHIVKDALHSLGDSSRQGDVGR